MWYIIIGIIVLGILAAIAGYFRNRKLQKMLERGEIAEIPESAGTCYGRMLRAA